MGGLGSGFSPGISGYRKLTTAEVLALDIKNIGIKREVKFKGAIISWKKGSNIGMAKLNEDEVILHYTNTINGISKNYNYRVGLDYTICNYGGERVWFICPDCGRRVRILYQRKGMFKCRSCQSLNYILQQEDKRDYAMQSIDHKMYKIQDKLKTKRDIDNIFHIPKPKGMHCKTYDRLMKQLENLYIQRDYTFGALMCSYKTGILKDAYQSILNKRK